MRLALLGSGRIAVVAAGIAAWLVTSTAAAVEIELRDVAPDRVERQRAYNRGQVPLPSTPDLSKLDERLAARGVKLGSAILIRIFKASSELEVWLQKGERFVLLDTYPICHWTGTLGPKLKEGDRQSPEGFYSVSSRQMRLVGRWQKAFNLGFPNGYDQLHSRTGSFILVHGGCSSVGCFAMTEQVQEEIYTLASAAVKAGQERFPVHAFPFRMTDAAMAEHRGHLWYPFWEELKAGYDSFERTRIPPKINICEQRYHAADGEPGYTGDQKQIGILRAITAAAARNSGTENACLIATERIARQSSAVAVIETGSTDTAAVASAAADEAVETEKSRKTEAAAADPAKAMVRKRARKPSQAATAAPAAATGQSEMDKIHDPGASPDRKRWSRLQEGG